MKRTAEKRARDKRPGGRLIQPKAIPKIAIVRARFNAEITEELERGALKRLADLGVEVPSDWIVTVPGAVEIPLVCDYLFAAGAEAVIALGCVIRGETTHYESVINAFETGAALVQDKYRRPVVYAVLTVENEDQARDRIGGAAGHKGIEAAEVAVEMIQTLRTLSDSARTLRKRGGSRPSLTIRTQRAQFA